MDAVAEGSDEVLFQNQETPIVRDNLLGKVRTKPNWIYLLFVLHIRIINRENEKSSRLYGHFRDFQCSLGFPKTSRITNLLQRVPPESVLIAVFSFEINRIGLYGLIPFHNLTCFVHCCNDPEPTTFGIT